MLELPLEVTLYVRTWTEILPIQIPEIPHLRFLFPPIDKRIRKRKLDINQLIKDFLLSSTASKVPFREAHSILQDSLNRIQAHLQQERRHTEERINELTPGIPIYRVRDFQSSTRLGAIKKALEDLDTDTRIQILRQRKDYKFHVWKPIMDLTFKLNTTDPLFSWTVLDASPGLKLKRKGSPGKFKLYAVREGLRARGEWAEVEVFARSRYVNEASINVLRQEEGELRRELEDIKAILAEYVALPDTQVNLELAMNRANTDLLQLRGCSQKWEYAAALQALQKGNIYAIADMYGLQTRIAGSAPVFFKRSARAELRSFAEIVPDAAIFGVFNEIADTHSRTKDAANKLWQRMAYHHGLLLPSVFLSDMKKLFDSSAQSQAFKDLLKKSNDGKTRKDKLPGGFRRNLVESASKATSSVDSSTRAIEADLSRISVGEGFSAAEKAFGERYAEAAAAEQVTHDVRDEFLQANDKGVSVGVHAALSAAESPESALKDVLDTELLRKTPGLRSYIKLPKTDTKVCGTEEKLLQSTELPPEAQKTEKHSAPKYSCSCGSSAERNVFFVGATQSGKSSTIRTIMDYAGITDPDLRPVEGTGNRSETTSVKMYKVVIPIRVPVANFSSASAVANTFNTEYFYDLTYEDYKEKGKTFYQGREGPWVRNKFSREELLDFRFQPTEKERNEGHIHLNLIDTPGLNDSEHYRRQELTDFDGASAKANATTNIMDEEHKVKIVAALEEVTEVHAVCIVERATGVRSETNTIITKYLVDLFRRNINGIANFHVIHTMVPLDTMFTSKVQARKSGFEATFNVRATHHLLENHVESPSLDSKKKEYSLSENVTRHTIARLLKSLRDCNGTSPQVYRRFLKSPHHLANDLVYKAGYENIIIPSLKDEMHRKETAAEDKTRSKIGPETRLAAAREQKERLRSKIREHDTSEYVLLTKDSQYREANFFNWNPHLHFSFNTNSPIRKIEYDPPYARNCWIGSSKSGGDGEKYLKIRYEADTFSSARGEIKLYGYKREYYASEIQGWRDGVAEREREERRYEEELRNIAAGISTLQSEKAALSKACDKIMAEVKLFNSKEVCFSKWDKKCEYLASGNLYCAAYAHGEPIMVRTAAFPPDNKKELEGYRVALEEESEALATINKELIVAIEEAKRMSKIYEQANALIVAAIQNKSRQLHYIQKTPLDPGLETPPELKEALANTETALCDALERQIGVLVSSLGSFSQLGDSHQHFQSDLESQKQYVDTVLSCIDETRTQCSYASSGTVDEISGAVWTALNHACGQKRAARRDVDVRHPAVALLYGMAKKKDIDKKKKDGMEVGVQD